ncbi:MAG: aspartate aminotransferase family protein [Gammaproteobacteria bacterium]|nr:aspartate aminotransferase family protein [Gammaproteobacteria bacterium]
MSKSTLMANYARLPVTFERGEGVWLWSDQGERYLDALSGIGVCSLGHSHPNITKALCEQAGKLLHTSNLYHIPQQTALAERLTSLSGMETAYFCNSGAEANEALIKMARLYGHQKDIDLPVIVTMKSSFHGRTMGALSATGNPKIQVNFEPLLPGFIHIAYDDLDALEAISNNKNIVAVLLEPIQGEGGVNIPSADYLSGVRSICDRNEWLMMVDEVQTGICRTGDWFAYQHCNIVPDVIALAKGLGNGVPIGACLAKGVAATLFQAGSHGSTFGGNPLVCSVALAVLETLENMQASQHVFAMGQLLKDGLNEAFKDKAYVKAVRGQGLMIGIELDRPCTELIGAALENHLLVSVQAEKVIRLLPPLIINKSEIKQLVRAVSSLVNTFCE